MSTQEDPPEPIEPPKEHGDGFSPTPRPERALVEHEGDVSKLGPATSPPPGH